MKKKATRPKKVVIGWAGIVDGKINTWSNDGPGQLAIWTTRREAQKRYEDVRKVEVRFR